MKISITSKQSKPSYTFIPSKLSLSSKALLGEIFWSFCKISPISFGGGYAMIPAIEKEIVEKRQWMDEEEISGALSIAGSAPGGIGINAATLIGYRIAGIQGAIAAIIGMGLPTFIIMLSLTIGYASVENSVKASAAFEGIHSAVVAFIVIAGWRMLKSAIHDKSTLLIVTAGLVALLFTTMHPALLLLIGTTAGLWILKIKEKLHIQSTGFKSGKSAIPGSNSAMAGQFMWGDGI
ncbi:chromate transporter [Paenibacillus agricola]|nr:chromate transporter [Paenibacillus agricola]